MVSVPTSLNDHPHGVDDEAHEHPSEMQYVKIALFLALITGVEVAIYYIEALESVLVPVLITLSAVKFVYVVSYFMHLKFDDKRLTWLFIMGMVFAVGTFIGTWALMHFHKVAEFVDRMTAS